MKIAIITTKNQWFEKYAKELSNKLKCTLYFSHDKLNGYDIVFILSYHNIIPLKFIKENKHNIVIHASALPKGKGWAPMFWQILEGENEIPFTMFEAGQGVDDGDIYVQKTLKLTGYELHDELREKQANFTMDMCIEFIKNYDKYKIPKPPNGEESFYLKRTPQDAKLDLDKSIKEQFNLLRVCSNEEYPAFFEIDGNKYILRVEKVEK